VGTVPAFLEADTPRVPYPEHGVVVAHVPWARHGAAHPRDFDETMTWLATQSSKSAITELMRIAWRTVGSITARVWAEVDALGDRLDGLSRIGIDEISYKRGHRYIRATLRRFFDPLGPERSAAITHVSADQADWIAEIVTERCPATVQCADAFHIVKWGPPKPSTRSAARPGTTPADPGRPTATGAASASPPVTRAS